MVNFADHGIALTRRFPGAEIWLSLKVHGVGWFRALIERCCNLAGYAEALLRQRPSLRYPSRQLSVVAFRYTGGVTDGEALDRLNLAIWRNYMPAAGVPVLDALNGRVALRLCFVNWRTTAADVDEVLGLIERFGDRRNSQPRIRKSLDQPRPRSGTLGWENHSGPYRTVPRNLKAMCNIWERETWHFLMKWPEGLTPSLWRFTRCCMRQAMDSLLGTALPHCYPTCGTKRPKVIQQVSPTTGQQGFTTITSRKPSLAGKYSFKGNGFSRRTLLLQFATRRGIPSIMARGHSGLWDWSSQTDQDFIDAYTKEATAITDPTQRISLNYYLGPTDAKGRKETFSELFTICTAEGMIVLGWKNC